jgi:hypothetical protein
MLDSLAFGMACLGLRGQLLRANKIFVERPSYELRTVLGKCINQTVLPDASCFSQLISMFESPTRSTTASWKC